MMNKNKAAKEGRTELQLGPNRGLTGRRHQSKDSELELEMYTCAPRTNEDVLVT